MDVFGLKKNAENANRKKMEAFLLDNETIEVFEQLSMDFIAITSRKRIIAHEEEMVGGDGTTYFFQDTQLTGVGYYHFKGIKMVGGEGLTLMLGSKEIKLKSGDKEQTQRCVRFISRLIWGR